MKRITRLIGFALALLLVFAGVLILTTGWLRNQNSRLHRQTLETRAVQFAEIIELAHCGPPPWSEDLHRRFERVLDASIVVAANPSPALVPGTGESGQRWSFQHFFRDEAGQPVARVDVTLAPPPTVRAVVIVQRIGAILLSFALLLLVVLILLAVLDRRWLRADDDLQPQAEKTRPESDFGMISHLAERSARQSLELEREREDRQRAEADAHLKQILLNRALQEKIDMGRDLHDGLIQSLYATGLTIQASRKAIDQDPALARQQIETALTTLNNAIREVRTYISGLGPEKLQQRSFADSVRAIIESLSAVREIASDIRIDEDAAHQLSAEQTTDLLQIVREAVSNSLRHGHARHIAVRLHRNAQELCLLVQDDGRGFDPQQAVRGHGLDNMQARANRLGARLDCQSEPGRGTRFVLTFTAPVSALPT